MTLSTANCSVTAAANGSTTSFAFTFLIPYQADGVTPAVAVWVNSSLGVRTPLVLATDYTITGVGVAGGGTVNTIGGSSPWAAGNTITIERNLAYVQPDVFTNTGFLPSTVEDCADTLDMQTQQLNRDLAKVWAAPTVVGSLPTAQNSTGYRRFVTDSTVAAAANFGAIVAGSGANYVPVYCDGQHWRIG